MIHSVVLFVHITGVLAMFASLALEAVGVAPAGKTLPRVLGVGAGLAVLSGFYLGARAGVLGVEWMRASYAAIIVMIAAGALAQRSETARRISLQARVAFGLAVVFLMVAKPDAMVSLVVLGLALAVSALALLRRDAVGIPTRTSTARLAGPSAHP